MRSPRSPRRSFPRRGPYGPRPRRRPPRRPRCATSGRRPRRRPAAPPTPSPDSPTGCGSAASWQVKLRELADEATESEARAQFCLERARAADEDRRATQRGADDARRTARALRAERAEIAGAPDDVPETDSDAPKHPLAALREAYRAASQVYEKVGVGADLRAEQARAESDESSAIADLGRLTNKVRNRAEQLLQSPDGSDGPSRQAAAARAEELVQLLETRVSTSSEQLGRLRGEAERHAPEDGDAHTGLPEELLPRDADHAQALLRTATAELASRAEALTRAREAHAELLASHRAAEDAAAWLRRDRRHAPRPPP